MSHIIHSLNIINPIGQKSIKERRVHQIRSSLKTSLRKRLPQEYRQQVVHHTLAQTLPSYQLKHSNNP
ncbi:hypothetical protein K457DRAFT_133670 [Linnemannia elongata AG-77]|uniref:Uncharacterized protein n=1 Tax=Linnemannia elongata AG-77 TaxID=1314771 RepID=A0A197KA99_9FUNG|nr:hypothetical protein K457DRAFT_133670 [Linnemannia elongata AG-77]